MQRRVDAPANIDGEGSDLVLGNAKTGEVRKARQRLGERLQLVPLYVQLAQRDEF